jgi:RNA polymerase sigma factor (sigma-70 family)
VDAWEQFYAICDPLLRRFAISCRVLPNDVDDCVQFAWKEITVALPAFHDDGAIDRFRAWLHLIVHSKAMDLCRYRARHPARFLTSKGEAALPSKDADSTPEDQQRNQSARVRRVLADMCRCVSTTSYRVFHMRCIEGHKVSQVAAGLNLTVKQVRYRCCRMKRKFRLLYEMDLEKDSLERG